MDKELNVARVLKQLVYILEDNDFVLYYDKRFESLKPQIDDEHDYLYHDAFDGPYSPMTYLQFRDSESKVDYNLDYRDVFTHTLHYSKYLYPMPQNPFSLKMETYLDPYKVYSEAEAKELAEEIFNELVSKNNQNFAPNDTRPTKHREFITLTKEPPTRETLAWFLVFAQNQIYSLTQQLNITDAEAHILKGISGHRYRSDIINPMCDPLLTNHHTFHKIFVDKTKLNKFIQFVKNEIAEIEQYTK